jgi:hypothetical protein
MCLRRHRKPRHDMDERISLYGHDPDDVVRHLRGIRGHLAR